MSTNFSVIADDFRVDLDAIRPLVETFNHHSKGKPRTRVAAANSATLLLAATFEEFVREMAREYARTVVSSTITVDRVPQKMLHSVWRRTMETLARHRNPFDAQGMSRNDGFKRAKSQFEAAYAFCKGDLTQDIYEELIYNEHHMRVSQINALFKVSNLGNVCKKLTDKKKLIEYFGVSDKESLHGLLIDKLDEFFERRNRIAHSLNTTQSSAPDHILMDIDMFDSIGLSLCETLETESGSISVAA